MSFFFLNVTIVLIPKAPLSCAFCVLGGVVGGRDRDGALPLNRWCPVTADAPTTFSRLRHSCEGLVGFLSMPNFELGNLISSRHIWNNDISPCTCHFLLRHPRSTPCPQDCGGFGPNASEAHAADRAASPPSAPREHCLWTRQGRLPHTWGGLIKRSELHRGGQHANLQHANRPPLYLPAGPVHSTGVLQSRGA